MNARVRMLLGAAGMVMGCGQALAADPIDSDQMNSVVAEMLSDAETRSSLLSAGDAGHDGAFFLAGDGFRMNIGGNTQLRYLADFRDDSNTDDFESGFQTRFVQLHLGGTVNKDFSYYIQGNFDRDSGDFVLQDAYGAYTFANGWTVLAGQVKAPHLRETLMANWHQLCVESSVAETFFGGGRTQAIAAAKKADSWSVVMAFSDGAGADNTDFNDPREADYALTPRFQYKFAGDWKQFEDFTSPRGSDFAFMAGGSLHWQQSANTNDPSDVDADVLRFSLDLSLEGDGWNAFGAFYGAYTDLRSLASDPDGLWDFGTVVQGGFMVAEKTELFARYDAIFADEVRNYSEDNFNFITAGVNYYYACHAAKFSLDGVYSINDTSGLVADGYLPNTALGLLGDSEEGEFVLRAQFQLMF